MIRLSDLALSFGINVYGQKQCLPIMLLLVFLLLLLLLAVTLKYLSDCFKHQAFSSQPTNT